MAGKGMLAGAGAALAALVLGVVMLDGGEVERPARPGEDLARQLDALRGANDLVRAGRAEVGRDPALYPTAYGRLEAGVGKGTPPPVHPDALAGLARDDRLDTPAWRAHYVCLALAEPPEPEPGLSSESGPRPGSQSRPGSAPRPTSAPLPGSAAAVLSRAGIRERAESETLAYLKAPDADDDALTSLATRAAFLRTARCLGRGADVPREALERLAADAGRADRAVPVLYAVEALAEAGVRAEGTRVLRTGRTGECGDAMQLAAVSLLGKRTVARECLRPALADPDPQTRWLVRRALGGSGALPAPVAEVRGDGLVAKSPAQLGTLTATYNAVRALTASARQKDVPPWLTRRLRQLGADPALDPSDRVLLAMVCHRLDLDCGPQAARGRAEAAALTVPARLTTGNRRGWYGALAARAEFGLGCRRTAVAAARAPEVTVLADAGCSAQAERLGAGTDFVAQAGAALRTGRLTAASDAVQAALAAGQNVPQEFWDGLPAQLERYRDPEFPDLYADAPGGVASAEATRAAYYLLA
ncbi:hypothetical protein ACSCBZ_42670 [Streptomyces niveiscabiei]|uniref:hypothetical protein n=1 Tax=Streptomyces TaxID=1883 RepID=UPI0006EB941A|nr:MULTISPECIES: hypothetical protein [Streptomyces]